MRSIAIALLSVSLLCACGQKGSLYLPNAPREAVSPAVPAASPAPVPAATATAAADDAAANNEREQAARSNRTN
jgi:predicted small lipoprotein YifL